MIGRRTVNLTVCPFAMCLGRFKMFSKQQPKLQSYSKRTYSRFKYINPTLLNGRFIKEKKIIQNFDFFLILDFEATCEKNGTLNPQEIIEFPCLKMNSKTLEIESHFHQYVMPELNPVLTPFCVELTGILQEMLVGQPNFVTCMELFEEWMAKENLLHSKFALVTCGDWDLKVMFPAQCKLSGIAVPSYMKQWINIKKTYGEATGRYGHSLMAMLKSFNLSHVGRLHSGIGLRLVHVCWNVNS
ncbi:ERI1 exoribonuclease 3-like isoform X2 [Ischnura elegans]|uniref:ERI1 exoribonuclease 3-like isoform X2 n=1 Tax=Ischnura elegans TaxID=197161 RepID=UPI001ED8AF24|nr:ERI1 exoribonuclease 3-like isoform X2 [Ischnura elegans]